MLANPWALPWLLLAAPIVWLYRRRAAMPEGRVATGALWEQALAEERFRAWWLPRRHAVSLIAQLVILVTAVVALAQPRLSPPRTAILIIDNSASMNATDVEPSRFDAARQYARRWIDAVPAADRVGILAGGAPVRVVCAPTADRRRLRDAVETFAAGNGGTQVPGALAVARSIFDGRGVGRIVVLTDACFPEASSLAAADDVDLYTVGTSADNIAVRRVVARRHPGQPEVAQVLVDVAQHSHNPLSKVPLELRLDGRTLDAEPAETVAGPHGTKVYELIAAEPAIVTAEVAPDDALPDDKRGGAVIPHPRILRVVAPGELNEHLAASLAANPRVQLATSAELPAAADPGDILVLQGEVPPRLPAGPLLVVDPRSDCDLWELDGVLAHARIARHNVDSSILAGLDLEGIVLSEVRRLRLQAIEPGAVRILAVSDHDDPLLLALDRPEGRVVVLGGSPDTSELFHQAEFPLLLAQSLAWLSEPAFRAEEERLGEAAPVFPANESDLRVPPQVGTPIEQWPLPRGRFRMWLLFGVMALMMLVSEWCLYQRRWIS